MNSNKCSSAADVSYVPAEASTKKSAFIFKSIFDFDFTDGIYSLWPKDKIAAPQKEASASTAAKGDDDVMSTSARPAK
jgi:hypothetical protein